MKFIYYACLFGWGILYLIACPLASIFTKLSIFFTDQMADLMDQIDILDQND